MMARKRITLSSGRRAVVYTTKAEALRAKDRAPGSNRVRKVKAGWTVTKV